MSSARSDFVSGALNRDFWTCGSFSELGGSLERKLRCEPRSADFMAGAVICKCGNADFLAAATLCEPLSADLAPLDDF